MVGKEDPLVSGGSSAPGPDGSGQTEQSDGGGTASAGGSYFDTARLNRQQSRDSALALLQEAAGKESADQTLKDEANASIQTMADYSDGGPDRKSGHCQRWLYRLRGLHWGERPQSGGGRSGGRSDRRGHGADRGRSQPDGGLSADQVEDHRGGGVRPAGRNNRAPACRKAVSTSWRSVEYVKKWRVTVSAPRRSGTSPGRSAVFYTRLFSEVFFKFCFVKFRSFSSLERDLEANGGNSSVRRGQRGGHRGTAITEQKMGWKISSTSRPKGGIYDPAYVGKAVLRHDGLFIGHGVGSVAQPHTDKWTAAITAAS